MKPLTSVASILAFGLLQSCSVGTGPDGVRGLGLVLEGAPPMTSLIAPSTVQKGVAFQVTASTFGSSSCTQPDGYRLDAGATRAEIRLYDIIAPPQSICTSDLRSFPRQILLQFDQPGSAQIVVIGRNGGDGGVREILQTITVVP